MDIHVTETRTFAACRLRWFFGSRNGLGRQARLPGAARFTGSLFHNAVEGWNTILSEGGSYDEAGAAGFQYLERYADSQFEFAPFVEAAQYAPTDHYGECVDMATGMFENFTSWAPERWTPIKGHVEKRLAVRIPTPQGGHSRCRLLLKPDAIIEYKGRPWILEVKTSKKRYGDTHDLKIDIQMGAYLWGVRRSGTWVQGILRLTAYKLLPKMPALTMKGKLSRAKITTTPELVQQAIAEYDLDPREYEEWIQDLEEAAHPCFAMTFYERTDRELEIIGRRLYVLYRQMSEAKRKGFIYPNDGPMTCNWCDYKEPCRLVNQGGDFHFALEEEFYRDDR